MNWQSLFFVEDQNSIEVDAIMINSILFISEDMQEATEDARSYARRYGRCKKICKKIQKMQEDMQDDTEDARRCARRYRRCKKICKRICEDHQWVYELAIIAFALDVFHLICLLHNIIIIFIVIILFIIIVILIIHIIIQIVNNKHTVFPLLPLLFGIAFHLQLVLLS